MYAKSNNIGITADLEQFGGRKWQLVKVAVDPTKKQGKGYRLLPAPPVTLRDENGQGKSVRLVGGILEKDGTFKVAMYYVTPGQN